MAYFAESRAMATTLSPLSGSNVSNLRLSGLLILEELKCFPHFEYSAEVFIRDLMRFGQDKAAQAGLNQTHDGFFSPGRSLFPTRAGGDSAYDTGGKVRAG